MICIGIWKTDVIVGLDRRSSLRYCYSSQSHYTLVSDCKLQDPQVLPCDATIQMLRRPAANLRLTWLAIVDHHLQFVVCCRSASLCNKPAILFIDSRIFNICPRLVVSPLPGIGCFSLRSQGLWQRRGQPRARSLHAQAITFRYTDQICCSSMSSLVCRLRRRQQTATHASDMHLLAILS